MRILYCDCCKKQEDQPEISLPEGWIEIEDGTEEDTRYLHFCSVVCLRTYYTLDEFDPVTTAQRILRDPRS